MKLWMKAEGRLSKGSVGACRSQVWGRLCAFVLIVNLIVSGWSQSHTPEIRWIAGGLPASITAFEVSPDGQWLAIAGGSDAGNRVIQLWHLPEMRLIRTYKVSD